MTVTPTARRGAGNLASMITGRIATQAVLVASAFIIPRVLGIEGYGQYAAVMAVITMVQVLSSGGLPMVEVRELPPLVDSSGREKAVVLGSTIWVTRVLLSLVAGLAAFVWLSRSEVLVPSAAVLLSLVALTILRSVFEATRSQLLPLGRMSAFAAFDVVRAILVLVVVVTAFTLAGIEGVLQYFVIVFAVLLPAALLLRARALPLRPGSAHWASLRPFIGYSLATFVGELSVVVQSQFAVFLVAVSVARKEAGILALTLQLLILIQGLYLAGRSALMPILAEFEAHDEMHRLRIWGSLMMRYGAAIAVAACVGWALVGGEILRWLLPPSFAPVHLTGTVILLGAGLYCCGAACNGLLYIRGSAWSASTSLVIYVAFTIAGALLVLGLGTDTALRITWVYTVAAGVFFAAAYLFLALRAGLWLPLRRTTLLLLPAATALPLLGWDAAVPLRVAALAAFLVAYAMAATGLGLLPLSELREIWSTVTGHGRSGTAPEDPRQGHS